MFLVGVFFVNILLNDYDVVRENGEKMVFWVKKFFWFILRDIKSEFFFECLYFLFLGGWYKGFKWYDVVIIIIESVFVLFFWF